MHKVLNYGSVLQAYALQHTLFKMGYDNEIIDYQFPKVMPQKLTIKSTFHSIFIFLRNAIIGFPVEKSRKKFDSFCMENYTMSKLKYNDVSIQETPPSYDVYMTGSDQVWNPRHVKNDTSFLLSFAPTGMAKVSYASSFACDTLPDEYREIYKKYLNQYDYITVRESTGIKIVEDLTGKEAFLCCDPTLLLNKNEWDNIESKSKLNIKEKYILVYALYYMFDPYPELLDIISNVQNTLGYKVIYLNGRKEDAFRKNSKVFKSGGPEDFLYLIKHAEFVITTSFHGTVFSLQYERPLYAIVKEIDSSDSRITSLLRQVGQEKSIIQFDSKKKLKKEDLPNLRCRGEIISHISEQSLGTISNMLSRICQK